MLRAGCAPRHRRRVCARAGTERAPYHGVLTGWGGGAPPRLHKLWEDAGIKLAWVAPNILGVSGRAMLEAVVHGTTDPAVLADLARGKLRKKLPALRQALAGRFRPHHAFLVSQLLAHVDYLDEAITTMSEEVEGRLAPFP